MLRICMVLHHCEPPFGGPEVQALRLAARFMERGHQVLIVAKGSGNYPSFEMSNGVPVYRLNRPGLASIEILYRLYVLREEFDIVHVHTAGRLASAVIRFAHQFNKKVFVKVTMNGGVVKAPKQGFLGYLKKLSPFRSGKVERLKRAQSMIAITRDMVEDLRKDGFSEEQIAYIPNGVDIRQFYPETSDDKKALRIRLGLPLDKTLFVFTGKITKRKGIDVLMSAWLEAKVRKESMLVLIGSGRGQKDNMEEYMRRYIAENDLEDSVLVTGDVENVAEYLRASDIFVFPSRWEGLPNSLLEAMAAGLLCIASDIEGIDELIIPGKTGILIPVGDIKALAMALDAANLERDFALSTEAVELIRRDYSIEATTEKLEKLFVRN